MRNFASSIVLLALVAACSAPKYRAPSNALGPYSASVSYGGLVFVAGKIGSERGDDVPFAVEARSAIDAVEAELARDGLSLDDCLTATVYLTDIANYAEFNSIYGPRFETPPARACIAVRALPGEARVEIQVVAARR